MPHARWQTAAMRPNSTQFGLFTPTRDRALALLWLLGGLAYAVVGSVLLTRPWQIDGRTFFTVWRGEHLYTLPPNTQGAYLYSPAFAQLISPLTHLSWHWFGVFWPVAAFCVYVWLIKPIGWVWGVPLFGFCLEDVTIGNISWLLALTCVLGMRRPAVWSFALLTKITLGIGLLWFAVQGKWRECLSAIAATSLVVVSSFALGPHHWTDWISFLNDHRAGSNWLLVRVLFAVLVMVRAAQTHRPWLIPVAMVLATPVLMVYSLGMLAAIPRLLSPQSLERARKPFGSPSELLRRVLDLQTVEARAAGPIQGPAWKRSL